MLVYHHHRRDVMVKIMETPEYYFKHAMWFDPAGTLCFGEGFRVSGPRPLAQTGLNNEFIAIGGHDRGS